MTGESIEDLVALAHQAMLDRGLEPEYPTAVHDQLRDLTMPRGKAAATVRDLGERLWCSIDNDDSRDIDQITVAERVGDKRIRVLVGVADVDALVTRGSAVDRHARHNTTSVYTAVKIFAMLPEKLSTDLTSLNEGEERRSVVAQFEVDDDGAIHAPDVYEARVLNRAQLAYNAVAAGLDDASEMPEKVRGLDGLEEQIRMQDEAAQWLRRRRYENGALELETLEPRAVLRDGVVENLVQEKKNRARELIEDLMIAANRVTSSFLEQHGFPSLRRVLRSPDRWQRIRDVAAEYGGTLPHEPNAKSLAGFLRQRRKEDPARFPDLSLTIVKLIGRGEYSVRRPGKKSPGHFGLAVRDYTHSTAPNRRYPDLITQRLVKAAIAGSRSPYELDVLGELASHCTEQENAAEKVERRIHKSVAALFLSRRIGERFEAIVTGASPKGTWARVIDPPVEGMVVRGTRALEVGDRVRVELLDVDVHRGYLDFEATRY